MQHTTRALLLSIFILSGILLLPFASMGQVVITATAPGGINPLDVCGAPAHFTVKILSDDPAGIPSGVLAVQMPTGIRYVVGSAVYTKGATGNVTQSNTADPAAPVFALANIAGGDSVEIDFQAQADCRRINEPVNTNNYTVSYGGNVFSSVGDVSNPDNPAYNVRYAAMNISITSNASYSGAPGGTYTRTIRVQNGGFGAIPEMKIDVTNTSGLVVTGVTVSGASSIIANQAFPFAGGTYTLSGFGANGVFDNSDIVVITETLKIPTILCDNNVATASSTFKAYYGCFTDVICPTNNSTDISANTTAGASWQGTPIVPHLSGQTQNLTDYPACISTVKSFTYLVTNDGNARAKNSIIRIEQRGNNNTSEQYYTNVKINGVSVTGTIDVATDVSCFGTAPANSFQNAYFSMPSLPAGSTATVTFDAVRCDNATACHGSDIFYGFAVGMSCQDTCGNTINSYYGDEGRLPDSYAIGFYGMNANGYQFIHENETQDFCLYNINIDPPAISNDGYIDFIYTLPAALTYQAGNTASYHYGDGIVLPLAAGYPQLNGNTLTIRFKKSDTPAGEMFFSPYNDNSYLCVQLTGTAGQGCTTSTQEASVRIEITPDGVACAASKYRMGCDGGNPDGYTKFYIEKVCSSVAVGGTLPLCDGPNGLTFEVHRSSYGLPDNDSDGIADVSGSVNPANLHLKDVILGDTIVGTFKARVYNPSGNSYSWNNGMVGFLFDYNSLVEMQPQATACDIKIWDASAAAYIDLGNVAATAIDFGVAGAYGNRYIVYDYSSYLPNGFTFGVGDSILFKGSWRVTAQNYYANTKIRPIALLSEVAFNPANNYQQQSSEAGCTSAPDYVTMHSAQITTDLNIDAYPSGCNPGRLVIKVSSYYAGDGTCYSYLFPYEVRRMGTLGTFTVALPPGSVVDHAYYVSKDPSCNWYGNTPITPTSSVAGLATFDMSHTYLENGGTIPHKDEGAEQYLVVYFTGTCVNTGTINLPVTMGFNTDSPIKNIVPSYTFNNSYNFTSSGGGAALGIGSPNDNKTVGDKTVSWDFSIYNGTGGDVPNVWLAKKPSISGVTVQRVYRTFCDGQSTGAPDLVANSAGYYPIGTMTNNSSFCYRVEATFTGCVKDSLEMMAGFGCTGYPANVDNPNDLCNVTYHKFYVRPEITQLQQVITVAPVGAQPLCNLLDYRIAVQSAQKGTVRNIISKFVVWPGIGVSVVAGTSQVEYPHNSGNWVTIPDPVKSGSTFSWDISGAAALASTIGANGLYGVDSISNGKNRYNLRFKAQAVPCDFKSGITFLFTTTGTKPCGARIAATDQVTTPVNIPGAPSGTNVYNVKITASNAQPCNGQGSAVRFRILNNGPRRSSSTETIDVTVYNGATLTGGFTNVKNMTNLTPTVITAPGGIIYRFTMPNSILVHDSIVFTANLTVAPTLACSENRVRIDASTNKAFSATCTTTNQVCSIAKVTGQTTQYINVVRPSITITNIVASTTLNPPSNETLNATVTFKNTGAAALAASSTFVVKFYNDADLSGTVTAGDVLLGQKTVGVSVAANGGTTTTTFSAALAAGISCPVMAVIEEQPCMCSSSVYTTLDVPVQPTSIAVSGCAGVATAPLGTSAITGYTYSWDAVTAGGLAYLSATNIANPTFSKPSGYSEDWVYQVHINRGPGCEGIQTVTVHLGDPTACPNNLGSIGNYVWEDTNGNGLQDEPAAKGINGASVELWTVGADGVISGDDVQYATTTTANNGSGNPGYYSFTNLPTGSYYVRFPTTITGLSGLTTPTTTAATDGNSDAATANGYSPVVFINGSGTGVAKDNNTIDAGYQPKTVPPPPTNWVCSGTTRLASPVYVNGDPLAGGMTAGRPGFLVYDYAASGVPTGAAGGAIPAATLGAVWGTSIKTQNNKLYAGAFYKRHVGLGPLGMGGIYEIDPTGVPSATPFADVAALGANVGASTRVPTVGTVSDPNELADNPYNPSWDVAAYDAVGKRSLGGLDVSADGNYIWTMNLYERKLLKIDISGASPALVGQYPVANPGCANGDYRPFGVKSYNGKVYVGTVCSGETSQNTADLKAYVQAFDGVAWQTITSAIPLNYTRGIAGGPANPSTGLLTTSANWEPWTSTYKNNSTDPQFCVYPQPILSDMEFDTDGSLIVAFMDRNGHQVGAYNYIPDYSSTQTTAGQIAGDILRLCAIGDNYQLETGGTCSGGSGTAGGSNNQGPGGGEFYWGEMFPYNAFNANGGIHQETAEGGLAFKPGSGEIIATAMNPEYTYLASGVIHLSNTTGGQTGAYQAIQGADAQGKANGIGDVEIFCTPTVDYGSIGNYVWLDVNHNGLNDEPSWRGINGVKVELWSPGPDGVAGGTDDVMLTYTATASDPNGVKGYYYFGQLPSGNYYVKFPTTSANTDLYTTYPLTKATAAINTDNDSDPNATTGITPIVTINASGSGIAKDNNTIDAGYVPVGTVGDRVWADHNSNGLFDDGLAGINGVTVQLFDTGADGAVGGGDDVLLQTATTATDTYGNKGYYTFTNVTGGNYYVHFPTTVGGHGLSPQTTTPATDLNSDANVATGNSPVFTIDPLAGGVSTNNPTIDAGYTIPLQALVGNYVWFDADGNGQNDEPATNGINGITVKLYNAGADGAIGGGDDVLVGTAITANDASGNPGYYGFTVFTTGNYFVQFPVRLDSANGGATITTADPTIQTDDNSDADEATGYSPITYLDINGSGGFQDNQTIDCGYRPQGQLGDYVWYDWNNDGIQNEPAANGINGVTLNLYSAGPDGVIGGGDDYLYDTQITHNNPVTGAPGYYLFTHLDGDNYYVQAPTTNGGRHLTYSTSNTNQNNDSDFNPTTGNSSLVTIDPYSFAGYDRSNPTIDAGYWTAKATLGDFVWNDLNHNGIQDVGEPGIAGITVTLYDNAGKVYAVTRTDATGKYLFSWLPPATYSVGFGLLPNYVFSPQNAGGSTSTDSDPNIHTGRTAAVTLAADDDNRTLDAGMYFGNDGTASVGDYVWYDSNHNGTQDATEVGAAGVTVTLYDAAGNAVATTITDGNGKYLFQEVAPGSYSVGFTLLPGLVFTTQTTGTTTGSDADVTTGLTPTFTLYAGDARTDIDAGMALPAVVRRRAALGDFVWNDVNNNGIQDAGEVGIAGVTVTLYSTDGTTVIATTRTDAFGHYIFNDLAAGGYRVGFSGFPTGFVLSPLNAGSNDAVDSDANPADSNLTGIYILNGSDRDLTVDAGLYNPSLPTGSIGDYVWNDANGNGIQDASELGVAGVTVKLYAANGTTLIATTTTDITGHYTFPNLNGGDYVVKFSNIPQGFVFTNQTNGTANGSDADYTGTTPTIHLNTGEQRTDIDAGLFPSPDRVGVAAIGDRVWNDLDHNGRQDTGEPGIPNIVVNLYDASNQLLATTITDGAGKYLFSGLVAGQYYVKFDPASYPAGFILTTQNAGGATPATNSDADASGNSQLVTLYTGQDNLDLDAGLYSTSGKTGAIGDFVWNDLNHNGIQDAGEPGVASLTVQLIDPATNNVLAAVATDTRGFYLFPDLDAGNYIVQFSNVPDGFGYTTMNASGSNSGNDSDIDSRNGRTGVIALANGETNLTIDGGIYSSSKAGFGDFVWYDSNHNGIQDAGEKGIAGVLVVTNKQSGEIYSTITDADGYYSFQNLDPDQYGVTFTGIPEAARFTKQGASGSTSANDSNVNDGGVTSLTLTANTFDPTVDAGVFLATASVGDFVWNDSNGNGIQDAGEKGVGGVLVLLYNSSSVLIATTITNGEGYYLFSKLPSGDYYVTFSKTTLPNGASFATQNAGGSTAANDSDANTTTGSTAGFHLNDGETNTTIDAGITIKGALGDFIWSDTNFNGIQDKGEAGIGGVTVNLYRSSAPSTVIASTLSRGDGTYWFSNLDPDSYIVEFGSVSGYNRTVQTQNTDNGSDVDIYSGLTDRILLASGERNPNIDAGYTQFSLPIKLLYLNAKLKDCKTELTWATATELNNSHFDVERSTDGTNYTKIAEIKGSGNSSTDRFYAYTDANPQRTNYYRLVQYDFDGRASSYPVAKIVSATNCFETGNVGISALYPNPNTGGDVYMKFYTEANTAATISITDAAGKLVQELPIAVVAGINTATFSAASLASGTYLVQVRGDGWFSEIQRLVVTKP